MLTPEAQAILEHEKSRTGEPYVQIVHRAIIELDKGLPITSSKNNAQPIISKTDKAQTRHRQANHLKQSHVQRSQTKKRQINRTN